MLSVLHPKYRGDIDGLRAVAVFAVIGYHFFPDLFPGGFIGVDIFFVISGYLISLIIFNNLKIGAFNFIDFYSNRIRRICPALILVLLTSYLIGWFKFYPDQYKDLGKYLLTGASFLSNFLLWNESGYFDRAMETKPFMHLWSLGIEEQFYIIWPLIIYLTYKFRIKFFVVTLIVGLISFVINVEFIGAHPVAAFFSPLSRFWELLIGSLLACYSIKTGEVVAPGKYLSSALSFFGFLCILFCFFLLNKTMAFPGWLALLPTLGTALIIFGGKNSYMNRSILAHPILVSFGLISFPMYLWHWSLLSLFRVVHGENAGITLRLLIITASIFLAWLTFIFIEKPLRLHRKSRRHSLYLLIILILIGCLGYNTYVRDGLNFRGVLMTSKSYSDSLKRTSRESECFQIPYAYKTTGQWFCNVGDPSIPPSLFIYGDSHALNLFPALEKYTNEHDVNFLFTGTSGCPPLLGIQALRGSDVLINNCQMLNQRVFDYVKKNKIKTVMLIGRWTYYTWGQSKPNVSEMTLISMDETQPQTLEYSRKSFIYGLSNTLIKYNDIGVNVIIVEDMPQQLVNPMDVLRKITQFNDGQINNFSVSFVEHLTHQSWASNEIRKHRNQLLILNFDDVLCDNLICPLASNGKFNYYDDNHLSIAGSLLLFPKLNNLLLLQ